MMMHRIGLVLALAFTLTVSGLAGAQGNGNGNGNGNGQSRAERVTGLERAAQRHASKAQRMLAEGKALLRGNGFANNNELRRRQHDAEAALRAKQQTADQLLSAARGEGAAADAAEAELNTLLSPRVLLDSESRVSASSVIAPTALAATSTLREPPGEADLQATLDARLSAAVLAQAQALHRNPVEIHEWVRRNIRFIPTRGSIQGADGTLATRMGNATDIASLTIALLRASGIHARYVRGQIEIDAARMQRWLGVDRVGAVNELLSEGGIPFEAVSVGGTIARFKLEHVWLEAWVDMTPSRGVKHVSGDAWVALDPSFKDLRFDNGANLLAWMNLDAAALTTAINAAAVLDQSAGTLSALGADTLGQLLDDAVVSLTRALSEHQLNEATLNQLLARGTDQSPNLPYLMGTYPYRISAQRTPEASLPDTERVMFALDIRVDDNGLPGAQLALLSQPMVALYGQSLSLNFAPASADDAQVIAGLLPSTSNGFIDLPEALPAYLIDMRGELKLGNTVLSQSPAFGMGRGLYLGLSLTRPDGSRYDQELRGHIGAARSFSFAYNQGISAELADTLSAIRSSQAALASQPNSAQELANQALRSLGLSHLSAANTYQDWLAGLSRVSWYRALSMTTSYVALEVEAPFGLVLSVSPQALGLSDVSPLHIGAELGEGDEARFAHEALSAQSAFGYQLLEQMVAGGSRSATRVFLRSLADQQPIHTLNPSQLPQFDALSLPTAMREPLRAGLVAGDRATFTAEAREVYGWQGYGAQQDYPDARGGTSYIYGQVNADAEAHRTGAHVSALAARGIAYSQWLGENLPHNIRLAWGQEAEAFLAAGDGLVHLSQDPRALALSPTLSSIIAGTAIDHAVNGRIDPLIDQHLWAQMLWPEISIAPLLDPIAPTLNFTATPSAITLGESTNISASITDNRPGATLTVTADSQPISLSNGQAVYVPTRAGIIPLLARGRDAAGNVVEKRLELAVSAPNDTSAPVVTIHTPADDVEITDITEVFGSVADESLTRWVLAIRPGNSPELQGTILAEGTQGMSHVKVGQIDPTMMFNGVYIVVLQAWDAQGRIGFDSIQVRINGDMKLGHFSITFLDAEVPLQGIPIRITRTYDTRQSSESKDFGFGWSVDYQNVRIRESRKLGFSWKLQQQGGGFGQWCVRPSGSPIVTITLPDGATEEFRAKFSPECTAFVPTVYGNLVFEPVNAKTQTTLEQTDYGQIRWANLSDGRSDLVDLSDPALAPIDPQHYKLTTEDGMTYFLDQAFGVQRIVDPAGNHVTYTRQGITHSSGTSVQFIRDAQDRISSIVLPDGRRLNYTYNAQGDLTSMRDALDQPTQFGYLSNIRYPHYLQDIIDARGVRAARNEYDDNGRLVATIDANGQRMEYIHDIAGRVERIRNRRGFETVYVFDDNGWVLSETNSLGEQIVRTYDQYGNELSITDPLNRKTEFVVDPRGNIKEEKDPLGAITRRTWGYYNQLYTEIDPMNRVVSTNTYARNLLSGEETAYMSSTKDALGNVTQTPVDICGSTCPNTGNLKAIIDPLGNRVSFTYDRYGNVTGETDALGNATARSYDSMGRLLKETRTRTVDGVAQTLATTNTYDAKGQLIQTEYPDGSVSKMQYNAIGKVIAETDANDRTTRYEYDSTGRQTAMIYADGSRDTTQYDAEGNEIAKTDRAGRTTKMVYDAANRLVETIYPDATPGDDADNPRSKSVYDPAGQLIASINERNQRTEYEYDAAGRQTRTIDALGNITSHAYDLSGRRLSSTDALGRTIKFGYDLAGKLTETIYPDPIADDGDDANNPRTRMEYDAAGRKVAELDELGRKTTFQYDGLGRLTGVTLAAHTATPFTTTYHYDELGNKTTQTDALGRVTAWTYDRNGRNLTRKLPLGQTETFTYNSAGERTQHTTFNNEVMSYSYDNLGRIATISFPGATTRTFNYNIAGQIASINDKGALYQFGYDERDRLISATDADNRRIDYQYDAAGNRTQLSTPSATVAYSYDALNRLSEVVANLVGHAANHRATYAYDAVGNRESMVNGNGSTVHYQYDRRNRLSNLAHKTAAGVLMLGMAYTVDASGLRTSIVETRQNGATTIQTRSAAYQYDALKRLTHSTVTGATAAQNLSEVFTYDAVGNRLTRSCVGQIRTCNGGLTTSTSLSTVNTSNTYDSNDRLTREVWSTGYNATFDYAYDPAGNLLTKKQGTTTLAAYSWDVENRLVQAVMTPTGAAGNRTTSQYQYDASGIRRSSQVVAQIVGTGASITKTRTSFLVDPNQAYAQVLEDWTAKATQLGSTEPTLPEASLQNSYVFGDDLIAEARYAPLPPGAVGANAPGEGGNDPTARIGASTGTSAFHYDGLGSTRLLSAINLDAAGNPISTGTAQNPANETITDNYAYSAFGESDLASTTGTTENNYRYTGEQLDPNLGFYYLRARYMNPQQGRFLGMDSYMGSSADPMSLHKYAYANVDPISYIDPSGNFSLVEMGTTLSVAGIVNAAIGVGLNALNPSSQSIWGDVGRDFVIGAAFAPVGGVMARVFGPVLRGLAAPALRAVARIKPLVLTGRSGWERVLINMSRVMFRTTRGYPPVQSTLIGRTLKLIFPKLKWEQHHIFIQQAWARAGSKTQVYEDVLANEGLRRLGHGGWNLMPIPRALNGWLGQPGNEVAAQAFATFMYSIAVFGPTQLFEAIESGISEDPNP